jgi:carbamoyltransferase
LGPQGFDLLGTSRGYVGEQAVVSAPNLGAATVQSCVLGISSYYHDSAAALIRDGAVVAAAEEERFTRKKHDSGFPSHAVRYCLDAGGVDSNDIRLVAFYDKPFLTLQRLVATYLAYAPVGLTSFRRSVGGWLRTKLLLRSRIARELAGVHPSLGDPGKILFSTHHLSHAASAYYPSPFDAAAILTLDGVGEWATTSCAMGNGSTIALLKELSFPHSLGILYTAFTAFLGFKPNSGEYKVMGMAPFGEPLHVDKILTEVVDLKSDGSFRLNMDYFDFCVGRSLTSARFGPLFSMKPRQPESELGREHLNLAASIQAVADEIMLRLARSIARDTGAKNLCMAGGVALNCVANGKILRDGSFERIWIQPAAGDSGGALGAALAVWHGYLDGARDRAPRPDGMRGAFLGPAFTGDAVRRALDEFGARYRVVSEAELLSITAQSLADGKAIGWFQGRMEFGPRALGARSILGDPRSRDTQTTLNLKIKYREDFRPFAPAVLADCAADWFDLDCDSPYMLLVATVSAAHRRDRASHDASIHEQLAAPRSDVPAVTHVDGSARVQTVHSDTNPRLHRLIEAFRELTGCPLLVNTSFNVRGEPIVCTPEDAYRCFMGTELDVLAIENFILEKADQPIRHDNPYRAPFDLD